MKVLKYKMIHIQYSYKCVSSTMAVFTSYQYIQPFKLIYICTALTYYCIYNIYMVIYIYIYDI